MLAIELQRTDATEEVVEALEGESKCTIRHDLNRKNNSALLLESFS